MLCYIDVFKIFFCFCIQILLPYTIIGKDKKLRKKENSHVKLVFDKTDSVFFCNSKTYNIKYFKSHQFSL